MKKINILSITILIFSFTSGIIGAYTFNKLSNPYNFQTQAKTQEIVKENKTIEIKDLENNITKIAETISPSVVSIIIKKDLVIYKRDPWGFFEKPIGSIKEKVGGGTGFFITKDGKIITNKHVIQDKNAEYIVITNTGEEYETKFLAEDPINDLAILKIESENTFEPLKFIPEKENLKLGQFAIAIGNAMGEFQNSVSLGIISGKNRTIEVENGNLSSLIQTDAAINPGNSGGPLINLNGEVIGINTAIINGSEGIGFAIAITEEKINYILKSIQENGTIKRPFIGINYMPISEGIKQKLGLRSSYGAYIIDEQGSVIEGSKAALAGLEPGDIILEINGIKLEENNTINSIIQNKIPGETLELKIIKKSGDRRDIELELGEY